MRSYFHTIVYNLRSVRTAPAVHPKILLNRVQFENHGPARLGPRNVPAVPRRLIKGVELRFPNWMRFNIWSGLAGQDQGSDIDARNDGTHCYRPVATSKTST